MKFCIWRKVDRRRCIALAKWTVAVWGQRGKAWVCDTHLKSAILAAQGDPCTVQAVRR
jgi:hypothetical protein